MNTDPDDNELWRLLGQARRTEVSPFFSRNVLREVRTLSQERPGVLEWLREHWRIPSLASAGAALLLAVGLFLSHEREPAMDGQLLVMAQTVTESPDFHVIGHLDELLDSEENSIWLADSE